MFQVAAILRSAFSPRVLDVAGFLPLLLSKVVAVLMSVCVGLVLRGAVPPPPAIPGLVLRGAGLVLRGAAPPPPCHPRRVWVWGLRPVHRPSHQTSIETWGLK